MITQVKVFGSFATGLYLPTSDVDVSSFIRLFEPIFIHPGGFYRPMDLSCL